MPKEIVGNIDRKISQGMTKRIETNKKQGK